MKNFILSMVVVLIMPTQGNTGTGILLSKLESLQSVDDVRKARKAMDLWQKLNFLCSASSWEKSLNSNCYRLVQWERKNGSSESVKDFERWWAEKCSEHLRFLSWKELGEIPKNSLPESCQLAWDRRRQDLIYRWSHDDPEVLWRNRQNLSP